MFYKNISIDMIYYYISYHCENVGIHDHQKRFYVLKKITYSTILKENMEYYKI